MSRRSLAAPLAAILVGAIGSALPVLDLQWDDRLAELADFSRPDDEVPASITVDDKTFQGVRVHCRDVTSFGIVQAGQKRSFNVLIDHTDAIRRMIGAKTLSLLNAREDPTFLRTVLCRARDWLGPGCERVVVTVHGPI